MLFGIDRNRSKGWSQALQLAHVLRTPVLEVGPLKFASISIYILY